MSRKAIIEKSLENFGYILVAESQEEAIETANAIASEHLEIVMKNPFEVMTKIKNAGAIFLGEYIASPFGDYFAGPNHILPTNGPSKFFSPLSVDDFVKNPVLSIIPEKHFRRFTRISSSLQPVSN